MKKWRKEFEHLQWRFKDVELDSEMNCNGKMKRCNSGKKNLNIFNGDFEMQRLNS
jgi:hypothetical protein